MVAEDGGAPVSGPAILPVMTKCRKALLPLTLRAQGGVFVLRTERCKQLELFEGEVCSTNHHIESAEVLFVAVCSTGTRMMTGGSHWRL